MRVLYGVNGEGLGHATRSHVVIDHLLERHDVRVVASGAALRHLKGKLPRVDEIFGPTFAMGDGQIRRWQTVTQNVRLARHELPETMRHWLAVVHEWRPDVVITDFEPLCAVYARWSRTPLLAVDNINMIDRCRHDREIVGEQRDDFLIARAVRAEHGPGRGRVHGADVLLTADRPARHHARAADRATGDRRGERRGRRPSRGLLERRQATDRGAALGGHALPDLRDARRAGQAGRGRQPRVPPALQRGLRRGAAHRPRRGRGRRVLVDERGRVPGQAVALDPAARASSSR